MIATHTYSVEWFRSVGSAQAGLGCTTCAYSSSGLRAVEGSTRSHRDLVRILSDDGVWCVPTTLQSCTVWSFFTSWERDPFICDEVLWVSAAAKLQQLVQSCSELRRMKQAQSILHKHGPRS